MNATIINLSRKWRSKKFEDVIGQELSIRIIKNSLYKNILFPVYLFTGQHGCGKTSTARIFAAALNCEQLSTFRHDPKQMVPCLQCQSCNAMTNMRHPDFIEIDAASNTGVDNVRHIIDASSLLPVMGNKKIYLIDEAHMLSKAAFNAFLKILEDPPESVVFILATTDPDKIIETVRSRCFRLIFNAVDQSVLENHLKAICYQEFIKYEDDALALIAQEARGSVRDALNLLEQARFSTACITTEVVRDVLGYIDDSILLDLFTIVLVGNTKDLVVFFETKGLRRYSAEILWRRLIELLWHAIRYKYGVQIKKLYIESNAVKNYLNQSSVEDLTLLLERFYSQEILFTKTVAQHELIEMVLLQYMQNRSNNDPSSSTPQATVNISSIEVQKEQQDADEEDSDNDEEGEGKAAIMWDAFIQEIENLKEPLLSSIMHQAITQKYDHKSRILCITFSDQHQFFKELLQQMSNLWMPLVRKFTGSLKTKVVINFVSEDSVTSSKQAVTADFSKTQIKKTETKANDFSDPKKWPKTHLVLNYFPGTVKEIQGI